MRALILDKTLSFRGDYPRPEPMGDEALVRVSYAGVCATDAELVKGYMGFNGVPGHEFTGVVEWAQDKSFVGRRVTGSINIGCGTCTYCASGLENHCPRRKVLGILNKDGAFAEYLTLPEKNLHFLPHSISMKEGVFIEPLAAAFEIIHQVPVGSGIRAAVLGDGKLGLLAALVLEQTGCNLTLIGRHPERLEAFKKKGISVSCGTENVSCGFDLTVDCTGGGNGLSDALSITRPRGTVVLKTTVAKRGGEALNQAVIDEITIVGSRCGPFPPAIKAIASGTIDVKPFISAVYPLEDGPCAIEESVKDSVLKVLISVDDGAGV
ncbi:MAG: alcohol dehydrogenase catalytic domain-containing protein [Thermodesulfobacteriota bacterium]